MKSQFAYIANLSEDQRIDLIGKACVDCGGPVVFIVTIKVAPKKFGHTN